MIQARVINARHLSSETGRTKVQHPVKRDQRSRFNVCAELVHPVSGPLRNPVQRDAPFIYSQRGSKQDCNSNHNSFLA